jgi:hypothetical protein
MINAHPIWAASLKVPTETTNATAGKMTSPISVANRERLLRAAATGTTARASGTATRTSATNPGDTMRPNVEVTGTLRQGAARCTISNGAVRPLAATCPSRPTC